MDTDLSPVAYPLQKWFLGPHFKMVAAENRVFWGSDRFDYIFINKRPCMVHVIVCCVVGIYQLSGKNIK